jgi:hypothetical protein
MGFVALPELVAAVSNAGGLGLLGVAPALAQLMHEMVARSRLIGIWLPNQGEGPTDISRDHAELALDSQLPTVT